MKGENDSSLEFRELMGMKHISFVLGRSLQSLAEVPKSSWTAMAGSGNTQRSLPALECVFS